MNICRSCGLCNSASIQCNYYGNSTLDDYELLVISDYVHAEDDLNGYALSNPQYKFLYDLLNNVGVKYLSVPLVRCLPVDLTTRRYRKPTVDEYDLCFKTNTLTDINNHPPKAILMIGQEVVDYLVNGKKIADLRESPHRITINGKVIPMIATYHPYAAYKDLNDGKNMIYNRFVEDVVFACRYAFEGRKPYITKTITSDQFNRVADIWCNDPSIEYVSFDTESNTLDPHVNGAKITSFSVAVDTNIGYNIIMYHPELPEISDEERQSVIEHAKKLLTTKKVIVQHAKHEYRMTKTLWGFTPNITEDTMYMSSTLYMDYPGISHGLKFLSGRFSQMPPWEEYTHLFSKLFKKINQIKNFDESWIERLKEDYSYLELTTEDLLRFREIIKDPNYYIKQEDSDNSDVFYWMIPLRHLERYAGMDAIAPLELMKTLKPMIDNDEGFSKVYSMLVEASEVFANIEIKGLRVVDLEYWTNRYQEEVDKALETVRSYKEVVQYELDTNQQYNPNSAQQNADVFFKYMKFPVQGLTAKGIPSMSEDNLKSLVAIYTDENREKKEDDEYRLNFLMSFRRYKKLNKVLSTYFIGLRRFMKTNKSYDGIKCKRIEVPENSEELHIFPQYKLHTVATGRLSSSDPSLHTLPTESEVKKMFAPHHSGRGGLMVMADYASCELRMLGSISEKYFGDPALAQSFRDGHDVHKFIASRVYKCEVDEVTPLQRRFSKSLSFAVVYGSSVNSVAESTGNSIEETQKMFDDFYNMFPGVRKFIDTMHSYVMQYGCVRYPNGRVRHLLGAFSEDSGSQASAKRQSVNSPVQGSASDCAVVGIIEYYRKLREYNLDSKLVGVIHDALYIDSFPGELFECIDLLQHSMKEYPEKYFGLMCPLGVDVQIGPNMNDHTDIESIVVNEDGSRELILKGYDSVMDVVLDEMRVCYDIEVEILKEEEFVNELSSIANDHGVLSLTGRGRFNMQTCKILARKKV